MAEYADSLTHSRSWIARKPAAQLASPGKVSPRGCPNGLVFSRIDERCSCSQPWPGACLEKPMQPVCNRCLSGETNAIDDMRVLMKQSAIRVLNLHVCRPWFCFNIFSLNICRVSRRHIHLHKMVQIHKSVYSRQSTHHTR